MKQHRKDMKIASSVRDLNCFMFETDLKIIITLKSKYALGLWTHKLIFVVSQLRFFLKLYIAATESNCTKFQ